MKEKIPQCNIRFADPGKLANPLQNREVSNMKSNTQNAKITAITEKTLVVGIDVGSETQNLRVLSVDGDTSSLENHLNSVTRKKGLRRSGPESWS